MHLSFRSIVTIAPADKLFWTKSCPDWSNSLSPLTERPTDPFEDGAYIVGRDVAPGTWKASKAGTDYCFWYRYREFSGNDRDILEKGERKPAATILPTDRGFWTAGCGT